MLSLLCIAEASMQRRATSGHAGLGHACLAKHCEGEHCQDQLGLPCGAALRCAQRRTAPLGLLGHAQHRSAMPSLLRRAAFGLARIAAQR
jgi:hypothetical protein